MVKMVQIYDKKNWHMLGTPNTHTHQNNVGALQQWSRVELEKWMFLITDIWNKYICWRLNWIALQKNDDENDYNDKKPNRISFGLQ